MPAKVKKSNDKYRVVEPSGKLVRNKSGTPVDGGGHESQHQAEQQAQAINANMKGKK